MAPNSTGRTCPSSSACGTAVMILPTAPTALSCAPAASSGLNMLCKAVSSWGMKGVACSGLACTSRPEQYAAFWRFMSSCTKPADRDSSSKRSMLQCAIAAV
eukprot:GHUV01056846.1.p1 GENE.GHUV01056846.1~~GHUV01056846.1.p1  ORF type:complete len:102 (+),score=29.49 GHUV01056846.1:147-452(+)